MEPVLDKDELGDGEITGIEVDGTDILLARIDDEFFAIGDICTHEHCHLSDGWLEDNEVVCPCHHAKFDVTSGAVTRPPAKEDEPTYDLNVEDGQVYVDV